MRIPRAPSTLLLVAIAGCAHARQPPIGLEANPHPVVLLPRSSIAAVLAHRGELDLSVEQVERLQGRDDELENEQAALRVALERREQSAEKGAQQPVAGMAGGPGGRHHGQQQSVPAETRPKSKTSNLEDQLDDNDTRAYLAAEAAVLTEKQREPARDIAEKYREDLYDQRDRAQSQSKGP
jgi:hypothetical protein